MQTPALRCLYAYAYTRAKHPNSHATEREQEWDAVPICRHLVPSTITSCIQLIHLRTCRRPSPFCNRSWWPTVTSKKCSKSSRNQHMGNGRHLNSGALTWNWIPLTVLLSFQNYWQHETIWRGLCIKQTSEFPPITHNIAPIISTGIISGCSTN